jgi:hypothetical protein
LLVLQIASLAILPAASACAGGVTTYPGPLLTVEAPLVRYPVMLSRVGEGGRPLRAVSTLHSADASNVDATESVGIITTTVTHYWEESESKFGASLQLLHQVHRNDRWVGVGRVVFTATDYDGYSDHSADRELSIEAWAHP